MEDSFRRFEDIEQVQPYKELPFCIIVPSMSPLKDKIEASIKSQPYSNYIIVESSVQTYNAYR